MKTGASRITTMGQAGALSGGGAPLLGGGAGRGPMPWLIALTTLLTVLSAAFGLALAGTARALEASDRITVQILAADPERRQAEAAAALAAVRSSGMVRSADPVDPEEIRRLIAPWIGESAGAEGADPVPIPALIEIVLAEPGRPGTEALEALITQAAPSARVDDHSQALAPLARLVEALRLLAGTLVALLAAAGAATVMLAARSALDSHRPTIALLHLIGATDRQVARLFERRIARDSLIGGAIGFSGAACLLWLIGSRIEALGSELIGSAALSPGSWLLLVLIPISGLFLAVAVARWTIMRALRQSP